MYSRVTFSLLFQYTSLLILAPFAQTFNFELLWRNKKYPEPSSKNKFALYDVEKFYKLPKLTDDHSWISGKSCPISPVIEEELDQLNKR